MEITVSHEQGRVPVTLFRIRGELNVATHEQFLQAVREAHQAGARNLLVDLSEVGYISSAGIRALSDTFKLLRGDSPAESDMAMAQGLRDGTFKSPHLKLLHPSPQVLEVLKIAGVDMFLEVHSDLREAVASF